MNASSYGADLFASCAPSATADPSTTRPTRTVVARKGCSGIRPEAQREKEKAQHAERSEGPGNAPQRWTISEFNRPISCRWNPHAFERVIHAEVRDPLAVQCRHEIVGHPRFR